jgi:hypothetical protein
MAASQGRMSIPTLAHLGRRVPDRTGTVRMPFQLLNQPLQMGSRTAQANEVRGSGWSEVMVAVEVAVDGFAGDAECFADLGAGVFAFALLIEFVVHLAGLEHL